LHLIRLTQHFASVRATIMRLAGQEKLSGDDIDPVVQILYGEIALLLEHK
jgi:hypothetical protein